MICRSMKHILIPGLIATFFALAFPSMSQVPDSADPGWDLFHTHPDATFKINNDVFPFVGVPIEAFNFGPSGVIDTGNADTIVKRLDTVIPASGTTRLDMVALQLKSATQIDFLGNGVDSYFVTLQSVRGGPESTGQMTINFNPLHTFTTDFINVAFDVRKGSLSGPIVLSDVLPLTSQETAWGHNPPPGAIQFPGVNTFLDGTDRNEDFWPVPFSETHPFIIHPVEAATPEPSGLVLFGIGSLVIGSFMRLRCKRS